MTFEGNFELPHTIDSTIPTPDKKETTVRTVEERIAGMVERGEDIAEKDFKTFEALYLTGAFGLKDPAADSYRKFVRKFQERYKKEYHPQLKSRDEAEAYLEAMHKIPAAIEEEEDLAEAA